MKRILDFTLAALGLLVTSPVMLPTLIAVWAQDFRSPFYIAPRVGKNGCPFRMMKIRSMVVNADRTGVSSTSSDDHRITAAGQFVRRYKLDELTQLWNVLIGDMSLVGPRPNVPAGVAVYTEQEQLLLSVRPGVTDFASIVFSDEGDILKGQADPDIAYDQLIRPWKSRLGLFYIRHQSLMLDLRLVVLTVLAIVSRPKALKLVADMLAQMGAEPPLVRVARRKEALVPTPPPGYRRISFTPANPTILR